MNKREMKILQIAACLMISVVAIFMSCTRG